MRSSESGDSVKANDKARAGRLRRDFLGVSLTALCGGALALNLVLILGLLTVIAWQGGKFFWQKELPEFTHLRGHVYRLIKRELVEPTEELATAITATKGERA